MSEWGCQRAAFGVFYPGKPLSRRLGQLNLSWQQLQFSELTRSVRTFLTGSSGWFTQDSRIKRRCHSRDSVSSTGDSVLTWHGQCRGTPTADLNSHGRPKQSLSPGFAHSEHRFPRSMNPRVTQPVQPYNTTSSN